MDGRATACRTEGNKANNRGRKGRRGRSTMERIFVFPRHRHRDTGTDDDGYIRGWAVLHTHTCTLFRLFHSRPAEFVRVVITVIVRVRVRSVYITTANVDVPYGRNSGLSCKLLGRGRICRLGSNCAHTKQHFVRSTDSNGTEGERTVTMDVRSRSAYCLSLLR